ncbi:MAG: DeoR family transcriptional regulator, partial [Oscillibacter sp.]|nr:DeoR family transcriptional regulator [Oscillibacter sp.]
MPTIRRDLTELVNRDLIIRSNGGAMCIHREDATSPVDFRK